MNFIAIFVVHIVALFSSFTSFEQSGLVFILHLIDLVYAVSVSFILPHSYSALDGDLLVQVLQNNPMNSSNLLYLHLFRYNSTEKNFLKRFKLAPDYNQKYINTTNTTTHITIGCQYFLFGGEYQLEIIGDDIDENTTSQELNAYENFQVDWPEPKLNVSSISIPTYPDEHVQVELTFPTGKCRKRRLTTVDKPEFWLEVLYCRHDTKCNKNETLIHTIYTEQVKFLQNKTSFNLSCDLFGMAGEYVIQVRPLSQTDQTILAKTTIQADWNDKFVFNVIDRAIMPCDPYDGIGVLFEYPSCIDFIIRDRIRIYGKLQESFMVMNSPTTLEQIYDERIEVNQHKKYFDCELFSERHVEYCFAYVTQAIFGAVAEIRMDCVPTFPLSPWDHGGWGPWSDWSPCTTTCPGGRRHRYRFCDSPVPRYGARYCEGHAVETQECGQNSTNAWECLYGDVNTAIVSTSGNFTASLEHESISKCVCGCLVELTSKDETKLIASSMKSCLDNKLFWVIQANDTERIKLVMQFVGLPCLNQYLRIRNGQSGTSDLIGDYRGINFNRSQEFVSTDNAMLIEFFWNSASQEDPKCNGRFLSSLTLIVPNDTKAIEVWESDIFRLKDVALIQIATFLFGALIITMSTILVINYLYRYRKYKQATSIEYYSPAHTPHMSIRSLANNDEASPPSRAMSTTTLISEVVYFVKMRRRTEFKHKILRESTISEKSNQMQDSKSQDKQPGGSLTSGSSQSTQTIYKVVCPVSHHDDLSSVASFPCYNSKKVQFKSPEPNIQILCRAKEPLHRSHSSKDEAEDFSSKSTSVEVQQNDSLSSAGSDITLTSGCYSTPAGGAIKAAKIRATNQKECKDKENLEKLLSRPQSEFSLGNPEDFELDYYDYNVLNTADVPGSYLGMDPAYLIWIPPLEEESSFSDASKRMDDSMESHSDMDILPRYQSLDPGSNKESPSSHGEENLSPTPSLVATQKRIERACHITNNLYQGVVLAVDDEGSPKIRPKSNNMELLNKIECKLKNDEKESEISEEKETVVMKSPCRDLNSFYDVDDIQFVDD